MTELEALKLVKIIQSAYPRQEFSTDTVRVYALSLADLPVELGTQAVMELIRTSKWVPTIAEYASELRRSDVHARTRRGMG